MDNKIVYMFVLNTFADWEAGFILAELNTGRFFRKDAPRLTVKTFAFDKEPVTSMGGLRVEPDFAVGEIKPDNAALLLLPGSNIWLEPRQMDVMPKVKEFLHAGVPVAAICGATFALANAGILDDRIHTSNDLNFLKSACPAYKGEQLYRKAPAVTDGNLITASGVAPLEFTQHILSKLDVLSETALDAWYNLYKTQDPQYYFKLM
jgi:putative intracellular protease/amidase